jgi:hypothetical protein
LYKVYRISGKKGRDFPETAAQPAVEFCGIRPILSKFMGRPLLQGKILSVLQQRFFAKKCRQARIFVL